ncbi:MAG: Transposase, Mutator family [Methanosaeta sp. PtaB.Bin018]|jgi:transposase-like protein|nr:hypothetical protein [Methanothrix sp.]OPX74017.1 MAG: Transposase, Mutator family [Methanosaeta sp. PtaB.Bin018]OPY46347.1 MAG: Transposase, Mutator family [Methanosaeta sp. PtaU1.Bin016]
MNISEFAEDYLSGKKEGMRSLTESLLNEVMQHEATQQIQALPYESSGRRKAHRNGIRERKLQTIHGGWDTGLVQITAILATLPKIIM